MSMLDPSAPVIHKLDFNDMKKICLIDSNNKFYGFLPYKKEKSINVELKKVFIDEIFYVCSSNSGDLIDTLCSISFNFRKKRLFGLLSEDIEIKLNKPLFCNSFYSTYNPEDKISLKNIFFKEEDAFINYDGSYDNLFNKGEF